MKYINNNGVELNQSEAALIGVDAGKYRGSNELQALHAVAQAEYDAEISREWHCLETFRYTGTPLEEAIKDNDILSFDNWEIGKIVVCLERVNTEK